MGKEKGKKQRLKRISFFGHSPEKILRALMKVDPERIKQAEEDEKNQKELEKKTDQTPQALPE